MTNGRNVAPPWHELKTRLTERGVRVLRRDPTTFRVVSRFLGVETSRCIRAFVDVRAWTPEFIDRVSVATETPPEYWKGLCDAYRDA